MVRPGSGTAHTGNIAVTCIQTAVRLAQAGCVHGIVTAPINKAAMQLAGYHYPGHTEMLADLTKAKESGMMIVGGSFKDFLCDHPPSFSRSANGSYPFHRVSGDSGGLPRAYPTLSHSEPSHRCGRTQSSMPAKRDYLGMKRDISFDRLFVKRKSKGSNVPGLILRIPYLGKRTKEILMDVWPCITIRD